MPHDNSIMCHMSKDAKQKFKDLAETRVNRAIHMLRLISNLGNRSHYDYTPEQANKIIKTLQDEVAQVKLKLTSKKRGTQEFKL